MQLHAFGISTAHPVTMTTLVVALLTWYRSSGGQIRLLPLAVALGVGTVAGIINSRILEEAASGRGSWRRGWTVVGGITGLMIGLLTASPGEWPRVSLVGTVLWIVLGAGIGYLFGPSRTGSSSATRHG